MIFKNCLTNINKIGFHWRQFSYYTVRNLHLPVISLSWCVAKKSIPMSFLGVQTYTHKIKFFIQNNITIVQQNQWHLWKYKTVLQKTPPKKISVTWNKSKCLQRKLLSPLPPHWTFHSNKVTLGHTNTSPMVYLYVHAMKMTVYWH